MANKSHSTNPTKNTITRRDILKAAGALIGTVAIGAAGQAVAAPALGKNDQKIFKTIARYWAVENELLTLPPETDLQDQPEGRKLLEESESLANIMAKTPSDSMAGVRAKVEWLMEPENYNGGYFGGGEYSNGLVLRSTFEDVMALRV